MIGVMSMWCGGNRVVEPQANLSGLSGMSHESASYVRMWALSYTLARQHFERVVLVTDMPGQKLLVEKAGLDYDEVFTVLDGVTTVPSGWCAGKLKAYSLFDEPFCHFDGDVMLRAPLPERILTAKVFAECRERVGASTVYHPEWFERHFKVPLRMGGCPYNMGIFGGSATAFIREYATTALTYLNDPHNLERADGVSGIVFAAGFEQLLLGAFARERRIHVETLLTPSAEKEDTHGYAHYLGYHKRKPRVIQAIREELTKLNPDLAARLS